MVAYRCYFVRSNSAPMLQTIECDQDVAAITQATMLLHSKPDHVGIEIWKGMRLLARISRGRSLEHQSRAS
jgi:hypothetical protein